jgi:hypothetical protein
MSRQGTLLVVAALVLIGLATYVAYWMFGFSSLFDAIGHGFRG